MGFKWESAPAEVFPEGYQRYTAYLFGTGRRVAEARAEEARAWMKANAPWQDQTGRARAGLDVEVVQAPAIIAELIFHHDPSLDYPVYLETKDQGKFGVIAPAVDYFGPRLMRDMQGIINLGLITVGE